PIRVAVMGCIVNGPGEAKDADVGIAAGAGKGIIFRKGKIVKNVLEEDMLEELTREIYQVIEDRKNGIFDEPEDPISAYKPTIPLVQV
ncbi:MAG: flavodoxin-dependent (E)-4-hydroxy-3-methylbut-2-enyl-diphosphate synthase, partial [Thermomicrobiales bacterium]|nr:flavodoxin-dependent (E)-4-hydroxy-3-methylbut-2-enyl-diphosphate synthase [Thermomicrobiales bacterium]